MIRHVVLFTWKPEATAEQLAAVATGLASLPGQVPGVRAYHFGTDAGLVDGNADFALTADFDDADAYLVYRNHPVHQAVIAQVITPILAQRVSAQFEF